MREETDVIAVGIDFRWRRLARLLIVCSIVLIPFKGFAQSPAGTVKWFAGNGYPPGPYASPEEVCAIRNGSKSSLCSRLQIVAFPLPHRFGMNRPGIFRLYPTSDLMSWPCLFHGKMELSGSILSGRK